MDIQIKKNDKYVSDANLLSPLWKSQGIDTMEFRGIELSQYYPSLSCWEFGDFDCFIFDNYEKGNKVALKAGFRVNTDWYKLSHNV